MKFAKGWGRNVWVNYSGKVDVLKGNRKKLSFSHLEERFNIIQNLLQIFYIILGIKYITLHFASSIPTVAKLTFQLALCGCTLRVTSQTPYSPEYITPTHRENNQTKSLCIPPSWICMYSSSDMRDITTRVALFCIVSNSKAILMINIFSIVAYFK